MNNFNNNAAIFFLDMCTKQVEHYTKVIDSCETMEQLNTANGWILDGFKKLHSVAENLPRRRRKLCLSAFEAAKSHVLNVNLSKGLDLFQKELGKITPECSESEMGDAIGSLFESLAGIFPGAVSCKVVVKRKKVAPEDPENEQPTEKEDPEKPNEETGEDLPKE